MTGEERFRDRMRRERVETILHQTATLAAEKGWERFRVEDVAQRVGVAKGTIYLDFQDKDHLVDAALRLCAENFLDLLRTDVEKRSGAGDRLGGAILFLARLPAGEPELDAFLRWASWSDGETTRDIERYMKRLVQLAQEEGAMPPDLDPAFAAQAILATACVPAWGRMASKEGPGHLLRQLRTLMGSLPEPVA